MPTRSEAIKAFLAANAPGDLANLYSLEMECQVNVAQDGGEKITGVYQGRQWLGWTDGGGTWKPFRIPYKAATDPEYDDVPMAYSLTAHAEGIGMTGWNWKQRVSQWVAFDFDAITGHSDRHGKKMDDASIEAVKAAAMATSWVTVRKSSGGKGLHLYVFLPDIPTQNHNEHAALARSILGKLSATTGFDFESKVDVCGANMWVWHRKIKTNDGLALIKQGEILTDVPITWKDHLKVVTGHQRKILPKFIEDEKEKLPEAERLFLELTGQVTHIPLDDEHKKLLEFLESKNTQSWWDADHWMLVTHTFYLKEAHEELGFRGVFETNAKGSEAGDHNCFAFPMRGGGWSVRRYSLGVQEHDSWTQDGQGYTRCFLNVHADLPTLARTAGALEDPSGGFSFREAESAAAVASKLKANIDVPNAVRTRPATLKIHKTGRLVVEIEASEYDTQDQMKGWLQKGKKWVKMASAQLEQVRELEIGNYDDMVRHLVTIVGTDSGWVIKTGDTWKEEPLNHVKLHLKALNIEPKQIDYVLGNCVNHCWTLVNRPFQTEYPGGRMWNRNSAQLAFVPTPFSEDLKYPHWTKILEHIGETLNEPLKSNAWAKANGVTSGGEYLKIWISSLFKEPTQPLPYLFLYGNEESGKSILHEAISLLITKGYKKADAAITSQQGFNAELAGAIVCVIEEINLSKNQAARNRIKDYVTALEISIHEKGQTPVHTINTTHWIQCANESSACPIFPGDTRITTMFVNDLTEFEKIPKKDLMDALKLEAPDFLGSLLSLEIPQSDSRLNVPVIETAEKKEIEAANETPVVSFLKDRMHYVTGEIIKLSELYDLYVAWADSDSMISKNQFGRMLPAHFPKGRSRKDGHHYVGNISLCPFLGGEAKPKLVAVKADKDYVFLESEANANTKASR